MTDKPGWLDKMTGWRLWTIAGLCLCLAFAGCKSSSVYEYQIPIPGPNPSMADTAANTKIACQISLTANGAAYTSDRDVVRLDTCWRDKGGNWYGELANYSNEYVRSSVRRSQTALPLGAWPVKLKVPR